MTTVQVIVTVLMMIASLALIVSVLLQKGDAEGISALSGGGANSFFDKNKSKTLEGRLATMTKASAIAFVALGLVLVFV